MISNLRLSALALVLAAALPAAHASPTVFFGENESPNRTVSGDPLASRNAFVNSLTGVGTQTFDTLSTGATGPLALSFPGYGSSNIQATLTGDGVVTATPVGNNGYSGGRFNTTGATAGPVSGQWWDVSSAFTITFDKGISAFGFYGTDIGDFDGQVTVALTDSNNVVTTLTINNTVSGNDGSLLFWGFTDNAGSYKSITFGNTSGGFDSFGFDDMVIGDLCQVNGGVGCGGGTVPEPGSLALVGLSLAGLAFAGRRKTQR
jgi:hypothetical protein